MNMEAETVVFYHLPKTAGTTLNQIVRQNYTAERIVTPGIDSHAFVADFATWPDEKKAQIRLLQGHLPFGIHYQLPQPSRCFTILRHPVERTISYYYHAMRDPQHYLYDLIHTDKMDLAGLITSGEALMMNDGQTRLLSSVWGDAPAGGVTDEMLDTAVANLRKMTVVGLTEQFDATLLLLQHTFGWQNLYYTHANVGTNRRSSSHLDAATIATVTQYNQQDMRLYKAGQEIFAQQLKGFTPLIAANVTVFRLRQKAHHFSFAYYWRKFFK